MKQKELYLLAIIYIAFIALGLPDALLGSAWNMVRSDLNTSLGTLGFMTITIYCFSILATFNAPRLLRLLETKKIVLVSIFFTGGALMLISQVGQFYQMLFFALPLGIGAGAIDVSLNHYLAVNYKASHMNYLHSFYGIGVTLGPTIMAYTLSQNSWRAGYLIVGGILLVIALIMLVSFPLWKKETQAERESDHAHISLKDILRSKGAIASTLIFLIYVHLESLGGVWIASYFYIVKGLNYAQAALFTTTFYLALTIGRLTAGFVSSKVKPTTLIKLGEILILTGGILMGFQFEQLWVYVAIVFLFGFGCAPIYPNMMFLNSLNFEKKQLSKIMSLQMVIGYMGFGILTPLAGLFFDQVSIVYYPIIVLLMGGILMAITQRYLYNAKQKQLSQIE